MILELVKTKVSIEITTTNRTVMKRMLSVVVVVVVSLIPFAKLEAEKNI